MAAYLVSIIRVLDREKFTHFRATTPRSSSSYGGEELLRGKVIEILEGDTELADEIVAVVRFADVEHAKALISSAAFQEAQKQRQGFVEVTIRLVTD